MFVLRDYQEQCKQATLRAWERGLHSTLSELFTGAGKTEVFISLIHRNVDLRKQRVLVLAPAHLIMQTYQRMMSRVPQWSGEAKFDTTVVPLLGAEMAEFTQPHSRVVVGSMPTLIEKTPADVEPITRDDLEVDRDPVSGALRVRKSRTSKLDVLVSKRVDEILSWGLFDVIIWDEAHHAVSPGGNLLRNRLWAIDDAIGRPKTKLVGFTATAWRADGIGLGNAFQRITFSRSFQWGIDNGYLSPLLPPVRVFADVGGGLKQKILRAKNWTDVIVQAWKEKASDRITLGYGPDVESSRDLAAAFRSEGIPFAFVDAESCIDEFGVEHPKEYRETLLERLMRGELRGVWNYGVFLEGTDIQPASCIIWARPTENPVITTQAIGRVLRLWDGDEHVPRKENALLLECTGSNLEVMAGGTLAGYVFDPKTGQYVKTQEESDDEFDTEVKVEAIDGGLDIRDTQRGVYIANGAIYSIGRLIKRTGSAWYQDEKTDTMSLSVSKTDMMVITKPFFTLAQNLTLKAQKLAEGAMDERRMAEYRQIMSLASFFNSYALWHVAGEKTVDDPIFLEEDSLDRLMDFATVYISEISPDTEVLYKRKATWRNDPMTKKQVDKLRYDLKVEPPLGITSGEASQLIAHTIAYRYNVLIRIGDWLLDNASYLDVRLLKTAPHLMDAMKTALTRRRKVS